jgi:hypothetical protein
MKFIHFGCWNNINCDYNYRDIILEHIRHFEKDTKLVIISGDNWYANEYTSDKKYKFYFTNILETGLIGLYNLDKECHIILGNHDEDHDENHHLDKLDCMLKTEKYYIDLINKKDASIKVPSLKDLQEYGITSKPQTKLITKYLKSLKELTNTSYKMQPLMLHECKDHIEYKIIENVLFIFINTNNFYHKTSDEYIMIIKDELNELLDMNKNIKKLIVVGHEPITSIKMKKGVIKHPKLYEHDFEKFEALFIDTLSVYNPIYLCADTHNFQIASIKNILQVVVGTGGASDDDLNLKSNFFEYSINNLQIKGFYHHAYGYSTIELKQDYIDITYKHIVNKDKDYINKEYTYRVDYNNNIIKITDIDSHNVLSQESLNHVNSHMMNICTNVSMHNLVKNDDNLFCYRKLAK